MEKTFQITQNFFLSSFQSQLLNLFWINCSLKVFAKESLKFNVPLNFKTQQYTNKSYLNRKRKMKSLQHHPPTVSINKQQ